MTSLPTIVVLLMLERTLNTVGMILSVISVSLSPSLQVLDFRCRLFFVFVSDVGKGTCVPMTAPMMLMCSY